MRLPLASERVGRRSRYSRLSVLSLFSMVMRQFWRNE